jgi:hypothetical protein
MLPQARRFPEGSEAKLFYEVGLQQLLICFTVVILISGKLPVCMQGRGGIRCWHHLCDGVRSRNQR